MPPLLNHPYLHNSGSPAVRSISQLINECDAANAKPMQKIMECPKYKKGTETHTHTRTSA